MYSKPTLTYWNGRVDSETDLDSFRYHQRVIVTPITDLTIPAKGSNAFGMIGFKCDKGVKRNKGRIGAEEAPDHIRQSLAKLPCHLTPETKLVDVGDVVCEAEEMENAQDQLGTAVAKVLKSEVTPIILGGGHETFYGHYLGVRKFLGPKAKLGMINIDAHFDMRSYEKESSSGTMFKQILDNDQNSRYLCVGIQKQGNTKALFETAVTHKVDYILEEELSLNVLDDTKHEINEFIKEHDFIILTLCTDVIDSAYAPGVSAPSPFGLDPKLVRSLLRHVVSNDKILSFDISEVNPSLDENNKTVTLAAHLVNEVLLHFTKKNQ
ncbi:formimidoylglutamase [Peribacillus muralis]|uniref:formimidoylglutamase n=1 Tax=Peribacillus muralis TaxID=264697 RepID=UPI001F4DC31F|nr:formimidoylglutamase [Peribacillus muralis]MCK1993710.1 formimidoylglutamase [Peribacillus muralis]MCK2014001.1 formimidoylglutamase [Peribacillus muralis]